ncbi:MAG: hypothetical protein ACRDT8_11870 [Micromonosporaceae bacterium]
MLKSPVLTRMAAAMFAIAGMVAVAPAVAAASPQQAAQGQECVAYAGAAEMRCAAPDQMSTQAACDAVPGYIMGARFFDAIDYGGNTLTLCVPRQCSASYDNEGALFNWPDLFEWNNRANSVKTFNSCDVKLFGLENFNGESSTWIDARANLASVGTGWNNRASSVKLS